MEFPKYQLQTVKLHPSGSYDQGEPAGYLDINTLREARKEAISYARRLGSGYAVELNNIDTGELLSIYYPNGTREKVYDK